MTRSRQGSTRRRWLAAISALAFAVAAGVFPSTSAVAVEPTDMVRDWNLNAVNALSNANTATPPGAAYTPPVASIHLAIVQGAVYDAVNSIDRGHEPYLVSLRWAPKSASKAAAAATAAHHVLVGFTPALPQNVLDSLDGLYAASLAEIPAGPAKVQGINVGATVAKAMLKERAADGRFGPFRFATGTGLGVWRPTSVDAMGNPINDPFAWVAKVRPLTLTSASQFRTAGPYALDSAEYAADYNEVKGKGAADPGSTRTPDETTLGRFYSANPLPFMNRALREIAAGQGNTLTADARLFAMTSMSSADALIGCWDDKAHWIFWRPITAIRETTLDDGNAATTPDPAWTSFFASPPYPEHPSGYNCFTGGMMHAAKAFFGTDNISFELNSPAVASPRPYSQFTAVVVDTINGRIYMGIHFRNGDVQGAVLGQNVAEWVAGHYFQPID